jgi:thymidylate kinase
VILLEAPGELLFARKGEGTVEILERRLEEYRQLRQVVPHFHTVDAAQPLEDVTRQVSHLISEFRPSPSPLEPQHL